MYLYTFFLTGIGFSSLWLTHANIRDIKVEQIEVEDVFAGDTAHALVTVLNTSRQSRFHIQVSHKKNIVAEIDEIPPLSAKTVRVAIGTYSRGRQSLPQINVSTSFPFLLLTSWKVFRSGKSFFVFPQRHGHSVLPYIDVHQENAEGRTIDQVRSPDSEFSGHRKFESSDSPRHIDWKAYARTEKWLVKDYQGYRPQEIHLQWQKTGHLKNFEDRLSQMALWIEVAEMKGFHYSFEFNQQLIPGARGRGHYLQCLRFLAEAPHEFSI